MPDDHAVRDRLLALIAVILSVAALRATYAVTMPLAVALVVIAAIWPVKPWLDRALPSSLSHAGTVLVLLLLLAGFTGAIYFSATQVVRAFAENWDQFQRIYNATTAFADRWGVPLGGAEGYARLVAFARRRWRTPTRSSSISASSLFWSCWASRKCRCSDARWTMSSSPPTGTS